MLNNGKLDSGFVDPLYVLCAHVARMEFRNMLVTCWAGQSKPYTHEKGMSSVRAWHMTDGGCSPQPQRIDGG